MTKKRKKVSSKTYKEEERTLYNLNDTFSNGTNNEEQNIIEMKENKNDVRARNNYVERLSIDEEINEQETNKWGFRLVKCPIFAMVFDC